MSGIKARSFLNIFLILTGILSGAKANGGCIGPNWIPHKEEKCYKVFDVSVQFSEAAELCHNLVPFESLTGRKHPSVLLTIASLEEQEFIQNNLFQHRSQNVWIDYTGSYRESMTHVASDPSLITEYRNWASANPDLPIQSTFNSSSQELHECAEIQLDELTNRGKWQVISCEQKRRVVCQNVQKLPVQDLQIHLMETNREFMDTKRELVDTNRELKAQKEQLGIHNIEIQELKDLIHQLLISQDKIIEAGNTVQSTNNLIQQMQDMCLHSEPIDLRGDETKKIKEDINTMKTQLKSLDSQITQLKSPIDKAGGEILQLKGLIKEVNGNFNSTREQTDLLESLSVAMKTTMSNLNENLETLSSQFKGSQAPIEENRGEIQLLRRRLTSIEISFTTVKSELELVRSRGHEIQADVITRVGEARREINSFKSTAVTNLRFGGVQHATIWRGPGYNDEYGWVITSVSNFNRDNFPDGTSRRTIQKLVNNVWTNI